MIRNETIEGFLARLASKAPTPGGGGAGALSGAVGCALGRMVAQLTIGRKKYAEAEETMIRLDERLGELQESFLSLADQDEEVFGRFMEALGLPKESEEEKAVRKEAVEIAREEATEVPLSVMEKAVLAMPDVLTLAKIGNRNAVSDAGAAAHMLYSALKTGAENVRINLVSQKSEELKRSYESRMEALLTEGGELTEEILRTVRTRAEGA